MAEMTEPERDNFLGEVRVGVLAIERADKGPLCAPVWYRYSSETGFEIAMAYASAKSILLRRHGAATICVQDEQLPYRYVTAEGEVSVELSPQTSYVRRMQHLLAERYNLATASTGREPQRRVIVFQPQ